MKYSAEINTQASPLLNFLLTWILPLILFVGIGQFMGRSLMKRMGGGPGNAMTFGKSNAKIYAESETGITFAAVAPHLNTANSCCHHVFLRHFRFQKCLPVYSNPIFPIRNHSNVITSEDNPAWSRMSRCSSFKSDARRI